MWPLVANLGMGLAFHEKLRQPVQGITLELTRSDLQSKVDTWNFAFSHLQLCSRGKLSLYLGVLLTHALWRGNLFPLKHIVQRWRHKDPVQTLGASAPGPKKCYV